MAYISVFILGLGGVVIVQACAGGLCCTQTEFITMHSSEIKSDFIKCIDPSNFWM